MAYYLGYRHEYNYTAIDIPCVDPERIETLFDFTFNFIDEKELKKKLLDQGLIEDKNVELVYLIEKGKKDEKYYKPLDTSRIYLYGDSSSFNINSIKNYLLLNIDRRELFFFIYVSYLKKFGIIKSISKYLAGLKTFDKLSQAINIISSVLEDEESKKTLESMIITIKPSVEDVYFDYISSSLAENESVLVKVFDLLKEKLNVPNAAVLDKLRFILSTFDSNNQNAKRQILIDEFLKYATTHNGRVSNRGIIDLGIIIQKYKDQELSKVVNRLYDGDNYKPNQHEDDYLEEEDYRRIGTTSEEQGVKLRRSDGCEG